MDSITVIRLLVLPTLLIALWYQIKHVSNDTNTLSRSSRRHYIVAGGLAGVAIASSVPRPPSLWLHSICVLSTHQALLIYYFAVEQVASGTIVQLFKKRLYLCTTLTSLIVVTMSYAERSNLTWFVDNEPYDPTRMYYLSQILFYGVGLWIGILGIKQGIQFSRTIVLLQYKVRTWLNIWVFVLITVGVITVETNLVLSLLDGDTYRRALNTLYHGLKIALGATLLMSGVPSSALARVDVPLGYLARRRNQARQRHITYLHERLTRVVPIVRLTLEHGEHAVRQRIEIGDARDIIWSHTKHSGPVSPQEEAELLFALNQANVTFSQPGPYQAAVIPHDGMQHNLAVARHLKKLERRRYASTDTRVPSGHP